MVQHAKRGSSNVKSVGNRPVAANMEPSLEITINSRTPDAEQITLKMYVFDDLLYSDKLH